MFRSDPNASRATGPMARVNALRFSTKFQDDETDYLYYGYRYCNPTSGRCISRDPIDHDGGINLYALNGNDYLQRTDVVGLKSYTAKNTIWTGVNLWSDVVWSHCGCNNGLVPIGTIRIPHAWIDADVNGSLNTEAPDLWHWIEVNYSMDDWAKKLLLKNNYIGAGAAFEFIRGDLASLCCSKITWKQEMRTWHGWVQDGPIISGNLYIDSPGGENWRFFWTRGRQFRLHLRCDGETVYTINWSYSVSPGAGYTGTLQLPP